MDSFYFIDNEKIREITIGTNPKEDLKITVGNTYTSMPLEVTFIDIDQNAMIQFGQSIVRVWAKTPQGKEEIWKTYVDIPYSITSKF